MAKSDEEFEATEEEYSGPRDSEDSCGNEEDTDTSATAFLSPETGSLRVTMNDAEEFANSFATVLSPEAHRLQTRNDGGRQDLPQDSMHVEGSFEDAKEESIIDDFLDRTCGCKVGRGKSPCCGHISRETIAQMRNNCHQMSRSDLDSPSWPS
ncbi:MAG: hypothetical protein MPL62_12060 [Alphaproteobacteria bacterium]|nr:hypothetical protein [Alphaproteobacteria bacterium]